MLIWGDLDLKVSACGSGEFGHGLDGDVRVTAKDVGNLRCAAAKRFRQIFVRQAGISFLGFKCRCEVDFRKFNPIAVVGFGFLNQ